MREDFETTPPDASPCTLRQLSTYVEIAARAEPVRALLAERGLRLHPASQLSKIMREAQRVSEDFSAGRPLHKPRGLLHLAHASRITAAILQVGRQAGALECLRRMTSGLIDPSERERSAAKDAFWEIDLAARLQRMGLDVQMGEPDLVITIDGEHYPVACKNIYSETGVKDQMRRGVKQLERFGAPGLVAFSIDELTPAASVFVAPNEATARASLTHLNLAFIQRHRENLQRFVVEGRCHGVMVNVCVVTDLEATSQRLNTQSETTVWTLSGDHAPKSSAFATFRKIIADG